MNRPVDLPRIRRALAELDRLAAEHPEIRHRGRPWATAMNQLRETITIMTPNKERIAKYRAKQQQKGLRAVTIYLTTDAQTALHRLQAERPDANMGDIISDALLSVIATRGNP